MRVLLLVLLVAGSLSSVDTKKHIHPRGFRTLMDNIRQEMEDYRKVVGEHKDMIDKELTLTQKEEEELEANLEKLKRKTVGELEPEVDSIEEVNTALGIADGLFEGDIIIPREELNQLAAHDDETRQKRQAYWEDSYPPLWTSVVFYRFNKTLNKRARTAFRKAAFLWKSKTCINFTELDSNANGDDDYDTDNYEDGNDSDDSEGKDGDEDEEEEDEEEEEDDTEEEQAKEDYYYHDYDYGLGNDSKEFGEDDRYILVTDVAGCNSELGKQRYSYPNYQLLSLGPGCETIGTAAHELGHALGFLHTHARHDRNRYITVNKKYVNQTYAPQLMRYKRANNNNFGLAYDYGSVMHYKATTVTTVTGQLTMVPKDVLYTETLGSAMISFYDLLMMNMLYNCTDICGNSTQCNGGFPHPRNCSECICPSGYGGQFCNERPSGCGEVLNATRNWTTLEGNPNNMTFGYQDGYKKCHYWIEAPRGKKVAVQIVNLPANVSDYGCKYAGVEIKTHANQRLTGYRFCSRDDINTTLISNSSTVPVMMYMRRRRNHTGIVLHYRYFEEISDLQAD